VQKSNSHYALQPYTNQSVIKSLLNCASEMSLSHNMTGREFQRHVRHKGRNVTNPICWTCKNCSHECAADCEHCHTTQHGAVL